MSHFSFQKFYSASYCRWLPHEGAMKDTSSHICTRSRCMNYTNAYIKSCEDRNIWDFISSALPLQCIAFVFYGSCTARWLVQWDRVSVTVSIDDHKSHFSVFFHRRCGCRCAFSGCQRLRCVCLLYYLLLLWSHFLFLFVPLPLRLCAVCLFGRSSSVIFVKTKNISWFRSYAWVR